MVSSVPAAAAAAAVLSSSGQTDRGLLGCTYKMAKFPPSLFKAVTVLKHENYKTKANVSVSFATSLCFSPRVIFTASHNRRRLCSRLDKAPSLPPALSSLSSTAQSMYTTKWILQRQ